MKTPTKLGALAIASALLFGCGSSPPASSQPGAAPAAGGPGSSSAGAPQGPVAVTTAQAVTRAVPDVLALTGTLLADEDSRLAPVVPCRVVEVLVERGDHVEQGQPLVRLRDVDLRLQAASARAQLAQARARLGITPGARPPAPEDTPEVRTAAASLALAEESLRRSEELATRGVLPAQQLDEARARAAQARDQHAAALQGQRAAIAALGAAEAQASLASSALSESLVRAPYAGEIAERMVSPGEYVTMQNPLLLLVRTDPLRLEVQVPQERFSAIHQGQRVHLSVDAFPDAPFAGEVRYVSAAVDRASRAVVVEAVVPNPDGRLRPGMFAEARLELGAERNVAVVPPSAILTAAGVSRAFVVRDGRIEEHVVTVLERSGTEVVVGQGLSGGETLATSELDRLTDGSMVTPSASVAAPAAPAAPSQGS
jgi:RND family efflux transporter MFP subunit